MIKLEGVSKIYGKKDSAFKALDNISLEIPDGANVAIIGKSGSGKSTLMHIMSGLDLPTSGSVEISSKDLSKMKEREIDEFRAGEMGFIFQSFFIEPNQTCFQNISLPLEIKGVSKSRREKLVNEALESVELKEKAKQLASNLSGGQKQRLAIARAIVNKPAYIFADEPTGNLDSSTGDKIIDLLFELNKTLGSTLAIVTHDHDLAKRCQYQIKMHDGKIQSNSVDAVTNKQRNSK